MLGQRAQKILPGTGRAFELRPAPAGRDCVRGTQSRSNAPAPSAGGGGGREAALRGSCLPRSAVARAPPPASPTARFASRLRGCCLPPPSSCPPLRPPPRSGEDFRRKPVMRSALLDVPGDSLTRFPAVRKSVHHEGKKKGGGEARISSSAARSCALAGRRQKATLTVASPLRPSLYTPRGRLGVLA